MTKIIREVVLSDGSVHVETNDPSTWIDERSSFSIVSQMLGMSTFFGGNDWFNLSEEDQKALWELSLEFHRQRDAVTRQHPVYRNA